MRLACLLCSAANHAMAVLQTSSLLAGSSTASPARHSPPPLQLADAARGMLYLHKSAPPILHRDLKTPNLLVTSDWHCKVLLAVGQGSAPGVPARTLKSCTQTRQAICQLPPPGRPGELPPTLCCARWPTSISAAWRKKQALGARAAAWPA